MCRLIIFTLLLFSSCEIVNQKNLTRDSSELPGETASYKDFWSGLAFPLCDTCLTTEDMYRFEKLNHGVEIQMKPYDLATSLFHFSKTHNPEWPAYFNEYRPDYKKYFVFYRSPIAKYFPHTLVVYDQRIGSPNDCKLLKTKIFFRDSIAFKYIHSKLDSMQAQDMSFYRHFYRKMMSLHIQNFTKTNNCCPSYNDSCYSEGFDGNYYLGIESEFGNNLHDLETVSSKIKYDYFWYCFNNSKYIFLVCDHMERNEDLTSVSIHALPSLALNFYSSNENLNTQHFSEMDMSYYIHCLSYYWRRKQ